MNMQEQNERYSSEEDDEPFQAETLLGEKNEVRGRRGVEGTICNKRIMKRKKDTGQLQEWIKINLDTVVSCSKHSQVSGTFCCMVSKPS